MMQNTSLDNYYTPSTLTKSDVKDVNVDEKSSVGNLKIKISVDEKFQKVFHYPHVIKVAFYQRFKVISKIHFNNSIHEQDILESSLSLSLFFQNP